MLKKMFQGAGPALPSRRITKEQALLKEKLLLMEAQRRVAQRGNAAGFEDDREIRDWLQRTRRKPYKYVAV